MLGQVPVIVALIAAAVGGLMGLRALTDPSWTQNLVRLAPLAGRSEGRSELRSIYGGLFTAGHGFAAGALLAGGLGGAWAAAAVGSGWLGAGVVRVVMARADGAATPYNFLGAGFELVMGAALAAPLAVALI